MRKLLLAALILFAVQSHGQWVRPNQFDTLLSVNDNNFEVYSQRYGLPRKASLTTIKRFMDQNISIVGDSVCITRAAGTLCVKLPAQAFTQTSQSFAKSTVNQSYSLPADTVTKYDYCFIQYESNSVPSGYTITLPSPSSSFAGKIVDVYVYLGPSSSRRTIRISGDIGEVSSGSTFSNVNQIWASSGLYRFACVDGLYSNGYLWQIISSPSTPSSVASASKRVQSRVINSQSVVLSDTTFADTDIYSVYAEAETGNTQLTVPVPDSSFAGKTIYYYPAKTGAYTNTIACAEVKILKFSTTPFATSTVSSEAVTVPKRLTGVLYEGTYYWEMANLYNEVTNASLVRSLHKAYSVNDTLEIDTILAYDEIHVELLSVSSGIDFTIPRPTVATKGKVIYIYPVAPEDSYVNTVIALSGSIGRYNTPTSFTTTSSLDLYRSVKLISNGSYWMWYPGPEERMSNNRLLGRYSSGTGPAEVISFSSDFSLSASGVFSLSTTSTSGGYSYLSSTLSTGGKIVVIYTGTVPTVTGSAGVYTVTVPANTRIYSWTVSADTDDLKVDGTIDIITQFTSLPSGINDSKDNAFIPAITLTEKVTTFNVQQPAQGAGWQVSFPTIASGAVTTRVTGMNSFSAFIIKANF